MPDLIIALEGEIGDPGFFMGRKAEVGFFLERSKSRAILSRRKNVPNYPRSSDVSHVPEPWFFETD